MAINFGQDYVVTVVGVLVSGPDGEGNYELKPRVGPNFFVPEEAVVSTTPPAYYPIKGDIIKIGKKEDGRLFKILLVDDEETIIRPVRKEGNKYKKNGDIRIAMAIDLADAKKIEP